jgi:pimeloyl-ACP methyl ester carboxylesterase
MLARLNVGTAVVMVGVMLLALVVQRERRDDIPGPTGEKAPAGLSRYYHQDVRWSGCAGGRCGTIRVPLDYAKPDGKTVGLNVRMRPADNPPTRRMLFVNPGGPGGSAFEYSGGFAAEEPESVRSAFGIVGLDPRGVGTSEAVECFTKQQLDDFLDIDPTPDTPAEISDLRAGFKDLGRSCVKNSGAIVDHMSTEEGARDLDIARAVLGQDKLDYFGASYGTQLGATYAHLFPEHTGQMVLDGGIDPSLGNRRQALDQAKGFEQALRRFLTYCSKLQRCPLGIDVDQAEKRIVDMLDQTDDKPLESDGGVRPATEAASTRGLAYALYDRDTWPVLVKTLSRATFDDGTALRQLADKYDQRNARGYDNNSTVAYYAVRCLDFPRAVTYMNVPAIQKAFKKAAPVFGPSMAWSAAECATWPAKASHPQRSVSAKGVDTIIVIGTTHDPATPYAWSKSLVRQLGSARLVTREGDGHTGYHEDNKCVNEVVNAHLLGSTDLGHDVRCDDNGARVS